MKILNSCPYILILMVELSMNSNEPANKNDKLTIFFQKQMTKTYKSHSMDVYEFKKVSDEDLTYGWSTFKKINSRNYTRRIEAVLKKAFARNLETIIRHNVKFLNKKSTYKMGINSHSDLHDSLFIPYKCHDGNKTRSAHFKTFKKKRFSQIIRGNKAYYDSLKYKSLDYRDMDVIRMVPNSQNIRYCCSSYALATNQGMEGHYALLKGSYHNFSVQQLIDQSCFNEGNQACNGGSVLQAFNYIKRVGITSEKNYPYRYVEYCRHFNNEPIITSITHAVEIKGEHEIMLALDHGPVVGFINCRMLRFYRSGIFYEDDCSKTTNHAVLIIGFGSESTHLGTMPYWIVQNFWGIDWGMAGFMKIKRGENLCGIGNKGYIPMF